jgi:hypothetical protein
MLRNAPCNADSVSEAMPFSRIFGVVDGRLYGRFIRRLTSRFLIIDLRRAATDQNGRNGKQAEQE